LAKTRNPEQCSELDSGSREDARPGMTAQEDEIGPVHTLASLVSTGRRP
jgi:hypothetical protein